LMVPHKCMVEWLRGCYDSTENMLLEDSSRKLRWHIFHGQMPVYTCRGQSAKDLVSSRTEFGDDGAA
jgi:hypothetical protein